MKFIFDECVGKSIMQVIELAFRSFFETEETGKYEFKHISDLQLNGEKDQDWIPKIQDKNWIIVV